MWARKLNSSRFAISTVRNLAFRKVRIPMIPGSYRWHEPCIQAPSCAPGSWRQGTWVGAVGQWEKSPSAYRGARFMCAASTLLYAWLSPAQSSRRPLTKRAGRRMFRCACDRSVIQRGMLCMDGMAGLRLQNLHRRFPSPRR